MKNLTRCPHCDATMTEYRHSLSAGLIHALAKFYKRGSPLNVHKDLGLTTNQWDNFQKLQYWGLVEKFYVDGKRKQGTWLLTQVAIDFLQGKMMLNKSVWSYRGKFVRFDGPLITIDDVDEKYRQKEDYINDRIPILSGD